jgi:hypothetical protein
MKSTEADMNIIISSRSPTATTPLEANLQFFMSHPRSQQLFMLKYTVNRLGILVVPFGCLLPILYVQKPNTSPNLLNACPLIPFHSASRHDFPSHLHWRQFHESKACLIP